jgi:mRNA interferase MazF
MKSLFNPGDVMVIDFPGVLGVKRRPTVVLSSAVYHASRPDVVVGLLTSQTLAPGPTDYALQDWTEAGLRVPSVFRSFFATLPPTTRPVLVGHLSDRDWQGVCGCVRVALAALGDSVPPPTPAP